MGERWARWGLGYQDKVATDRILTYLRKDIREGPGEFEGVRLADINAGRVDDFVLISRASVEGNSIKWKNGQAPIMWADLVGSDGLLRELADGYHRLGAQWQGRTVTVRLHTNRPASPGKHHAQLVPGISVSEFLENHWSSGPADSDPPEVASAWKTIAEHLGLSGAGLSKFAASCELSLGQPEPPGAIQDSVDGRHYGKQFDRLHKTIATWLTNNPTKDFIKRAELLGSLGIRNLGLVQRFPRPEIPYEKNHVAAERLKTLLDQTSGGYLAVVGPAGIGKSTLVQDVLTDSGRPFFIPYYAFLPNTDGNHDRGEALTFFQEVIGRLDRFELGRQSLGITDIPQGRDALRLHMSKANERYLSQHQKTVLLVDGLDHVSREVGLQHSVLTELPPPEDVPEGFVIILSGQPQAFLAGAIPVKVATALDQGQRRVEVSGLTRREVHELVSKVDKPTTATNADALSDACHGNPLILTYILALFQHDVETTIERAIELAGSHTGQIDQYYRERLSLPLQDASTRHILGLLCRAAPTIPTSWLQAWPQRAAIENLCRGILAPFLRFANKEVRFVHDSLIAFLKSATRSPLPGTDSAAEERAFHSELADLCAGRPCSDPVGRVRALHLLRAERHSDLLQQLSSAWLREAMHTFVPYDSLHPLILSGFTAASATNDWGHLLRLVLLDFELDQRTSRNEPGPLAEGLLELDNVVLALAQIRFGGRLLVDDTVAMRFAGALWQYAESRERPELKDEARSLYLQAKPLALLCPGQMRNLARHSHQQEQLQAWAETAPLFEAWSVVLHELQQPTIANDDGFPEQSEASIRASLMFRSLTAAIRSGRNDTSELGEYIKAITDLNVPMWRFISLLRLAETHPDQVALEDLQAAYEPSGTSDDIKLAYASFLFRQGRLREAAEVLVPLRHIRVAPSINHHSWGFSDVTYNERLSYLQELLSLPEEPLPEAGDEHEEASRRVENASRRLGHLRALVRLRTAIPQQEEVFRSLLLFHNQVVKFETIAGHDDYAIRLSKEDIYYELFELASTLGVKALRTLRDVVLDLMKGPAGTQFSPSHRRFFARNLFREGTISRDQAIELGLSSTVDSMDDDPAQRQTACFENATFLHDMRDDVGTQRWFRRASEVSAGAGSHKDYHMAQVAEWLAKSVAGAELDDLSILEKFSRAVEVAGGRGGSDGAADVLQLLLRLHPARAFCLAIELVNREVLTVSMVLDALIAGGAKAGAGQGLLAAIYGELYSMIAPDDTSTAALQVLNAAPLGKKQDTAARLMSYARVNVLPSHRALVARTLQDALRESGLGDLGLSEGLRARHDDSSRKSTLYRLKDGQTATVRQIAAWLSDDSRPDLWNPNPSENGDFDWWAAIKTARIRNRDHLNALTAALRVPDYRDVELLVKRAECLLEIGEWKAAKELAEQAIICAKDRSWHRWIDGAQKASAFGLLKEIDRVEGISRAREAFFTDLGSGKINVTLLLADIGSIFDLLQIEWPAKAVRDCVGDYLTQVLAGNHDLQPYSAFEGSASSFSTDESLIRFIVHLIGCPVVDVATAARRVLAQYLSVGGEGLIHLLLRKPPQDPVQVEHILAAVHVGSRSGLAKVAQLRTWIEGQNSCESLAVRSIAKRICECQGWYWKEVTTLPVGPVILVAGKSRAGHGATIGLDGDLDVAWKLWQFHLAPLEHGGIGLQEARSEFERMYGASRKDYSWADDGMVQRWMKQLKARHWMPPRTILGRAAVMRVLGRRTLSGQLPQGAEDAYDALSPIYDPDLELFQPAERPVELRGMDWGVLDAQEKEWLAGARAESWSDYPELAQELQIVGERTWFIRPAWEWPREERRRGLLLRQPERAVEQGAIGSAVDLTYEMYLSGRGQDNQQLIVLNSERQLAGPVYRWAAINSNIARELGWQPSEDVPFEWMDSVGNVTVKSLYWKDGWIWIEPPKLESLGEGWLVLATSDAVKAIKTFAPAAEIHLWVERHSHGNKPYEGAWHLKRAL